MSLQASVLPSGGEASATAEPMETRRVSTLDLPRDAAELERSLTLRDGSVLRMRAIRADDAQRLQAFHARLSPQSIVFRFFGAVSELSDHEAVRLSHVDYEHSMAVVATSEAGAEELINAVVRYQRTEAEVAEIALAVEDRWQGQGIGTQMLWALAAYACHRGLTTMVAEVMYHNERMLALLNHSGFPTTFHMNESAIVGRLDISGLCCQHPSGAATR